MVKLFFYCLSVAQPNVLTLYSFVTRFGNNRTLTEVAGAYKFEEVIKMHG